MDANPDIKGSTAIRGLSPLVGLLLLVLLTIVLAATLGTFVLA